MKAEDQNMDEQFRKAAAESQFSYRAEFWTDVESQLADDSIDNAFRSAANNLVVAPTFSFDHDMADAHLDEAFSSAASDYTSEYNSSHWQEYLKNEAILEQDIAFIDAANSVTADYHSAFWSDADIALQKEGLHYEYQTAYWNEARQLLDRADRRIFFTRWSAVAAILLLLSIASIYQVNRFQIENQDLAFAENNSFDKRQISVGAVQSEADVLNSVILNTSFASEEIIDINPAVKIPELLTLPSQNSSNSNGMNFNSGIDRNTELTSSENADLVERGSSSSTDNTVTQTGLDLATSSDLGIVDQFANLDIQHTLLDLTNENNADPVLEEMKSDLGFSFSKNHIERKVDAGRLNAPTIEIKKLDLKASHKLSFVANAGVGNRYSKTDFTPSLRTSIGFEYMRKGYGRMRNLEFGGSVTMNHTRQNDFGTERRVNVFNDDGGVDKFWYKLQLKDMIYTSLNGIASYELSRKQNLRFSFGIDYLLFVQSNMSYHVEADKGITTVNNNWGVKNGLNKFDLHMGVGYEYQFTHRFAGQINGNFGFFDRTDDQFIEKSFFDQEMSITAGVKYTFLRKS